MIWTTYAIGYPQHVRPECDEVKGDLREPVEPEHTGRVDAFAELPAAEGRRHRLRGKGPVSGREKGGVKIRKN